MYRIFPADHRYGDIDRSIDAALDYWPTVELQENLGLGWGVRGVRVTSLFNGASTIRDVVAEALLQQ